MVISWLEIVNNSTKWQYRQTTGGNKRKQHKGVRFTQINENSSKQTMAGSHARSYESKHLKAAPQNGVQWY